MRFSKDSKDRFRALSLLGWKLILVFVVASMPFQVLGGLQEMLERLAPAFVDTRKWTFVELVILLTSLFLGPFWFGIVYLQYRNWLHKSLEDVGLEQSVEGFDPGK